MVGWIIELVASSEKDKPQWLLVPLTAIYGVLTLWLAAASFQSAKAATRSAQAMEASVEEQRQARMAAYGARLSFPNGLIVHTHSKDTGVMTFGNPLGQPILDLVVAVWKVETSGGAVGELRYSTMLESVPRNIHATQASLPVFLKPTNRSEAERIRLGDVALARFKEVNGGATPKGGLCLIEFSHRAQLGQVRLVYDVTIVSAQASGPMELGANPAGF